MWPMCQTKIDWVQNCDKGGLSVHMSHQRYGVAARRNLSCGLDSRGQRMFASLLLKEGTITIP